jgi:hypothetical protein
MKNRVRLGLSLGIVLLTVGAFAYYLARHSYLLRQLAHTSPYVIIGLLVMYVVILGVLVLVLQASLRMCRMAMPARENFMLNAYSLFANFFMIGQAGPGVRAVYLRKHYKLSMRKYLSATLLYYLCYAAVSGAFVVAGSALPGWLAAVIIVFCGGAGILAVRLYSRRAQANVAGLDIGLSSIGFLLFATLLQVVLQTIIYFVELHTVHAHADLKQTIAYTGVANLALFVGLTPGAIGIRESFLVFSERLHHISGSAIVAANIIDRSDYILFLGLVFVAVIGFHAQNRFSLKANKPEVRSVKPDE